MSTGKLRLAVGHTKELSLYEKNSYHQQALP